MTRGGDLARVLAGMDAARRVGFHELKINCVVLRGENDDELPAITQWAWSLGITPRFIELMPIAEGANLVRAHLVTPREWPDRLTSLLDPHAAPADPHRGPHKY